jgi:cell fate (sporulation/competence/biofilm development) regulator YlbF (YheA/YmcA/DUF963 family)
MATVTSPVAARPPILPSQTTRVPTALGAAFVTLARDQQGQPFELFLNIGKAGTDIQALAEALGRLISLVLRLDSAVSPTDRAREIAAQLAHIGGTRNGAGQPSLPHALLEFLSEPAAPAPSQPSGRVIPAFDRTILNLKGDSSKKPMKNEAIILPPAVLAATESLVAALVGAAPIAAYRRAQERLEADPQAASLLKNFSDAQTEMRLRQSRGTVAQTTVDRLRLLQRQVRSNPIIMEYAESQQAAMAYLPEVNAEISQMLGMDFASLAGPVSC